jgi:hypothetical protein
MSLIERRVLDPGLGRDEPAQQVVDRLRVIPKRNLFADAILSRPRAA